MLEGRSVLVTGAGVGLGRAIALAAASAGAKVAVTAMDVASGEAVAEEIRARGGTAMPILCDVTDREDVEGAVAATLAAFGKLDAFVHNANSARTASAKLIEDIDEGAWDDQVAVALRAVLYAAWAALPALVAVRGTLIVLTSNAGIEGSDFLPGYSAVKGAQRGLVKSLAREWGPAGVRVNAVAPSAVTPALEAFLEREPHMRTHLVRRAALRRFGDAESDIGPVVNFLIGDDSAFISGQTLAVNGGALML